MKPFLCLLLGIYVGISPFLAGPCHVPLMTSLRDGAVTARCRVRKSTSFLIVSRGVRQWNHDVDLGPNPGPKLENLASNQTRPALMKIQARQSTDFRYFFTSLTTARGDSSFMKYSPDIPQLKPSTEFLSSRHRLLLVFPTEIDSRLITCYSQITRLFCGLTVGLSTSAA